MLNLNNLNSLKNLERGSGGKGFLAKNLTFSAPLTNTVTVFGKGSTTPTFTRATTASIVDHESYIQQVLSGEVRFWGARRVRNYFTFSQGFSNAIWAKNSVSLGSTFTGIADPFGTSTACRLVIDNTFSVIGNDGVGSLSQTFTKTASVAQVVVFSIYAKAGEAQVLRVRESTTSGFRTAFNLVTGDITYENSATPAVFNSQMQSVGNGWYRCSIRYTTGTGATQQFNIKGSGAGTSTTGDGVSGLYIAFAQIEDQTGKQIQAPSDYVSTNVLASPFHGAMVDGVKYFSNETQISQNLCRYSSDLSNVWAPTDVSISVASDFTPLGEQAYAIADNANNVSHRVAMPTDTNVNGLSFTGTAYIKAGTKDTAVFRVVDGPFAQGGRMHISSINNMTYTEVLSGTTTMTSSMVDAGNGWRKVTINVTVPSFTLPMYTLFYTGPDTNTYAGTGQTILVGSIQLRQNHPSVSSAYVPTTSRAIQNVTGVTAVSPTVNLGYLSELSATNLVVRSEEFDNASWSKTDTTVTANNIASPDAYTTADLMTEGVAGTASTAQGGITVTANTEYVFSIFMKKGTGNDWVRIRYVTTVGTDGVQAWFNLATGASGTTNAVGLGTTGTISIRPYANGWYRVSVSGIVDTTSTSVQVQFLSASADASSTRVNNATYYTYGAQLELGKMPTTYIPTTTVAVARNADNLNYPATGNVEPSTGTVNAEHTLLASTIPSSGRIVGYLGVSSASPMILGSSNLFQSADGTNFPAVAVAMIVGTTYKLGITFGGVTQSLARGNPSAGTSLDVAFDGAYGATLSSINIGNNGTNQPNGCIRNVKVYKVKVTNTTLTSLVS